MSKPKPQVAYLENESPWRDCWGNRMGEGAFTIVMQCPSPRGTGILPSPTNRSGPGVGCPTEKQTSWYLKKMVPETWKAVPHNSQTSNEECE